ncbi:MAG: hypothetical protein WD768_19975 [Phycisphaeraceae bacterium]
MAQLFNSFDPTPFPEKDLDADAEEFIVGWAREFPARQAITVRVHLTSPSADAQVAEKIRETVHTYFRHRATVTRRKFRDLLGRGRLSLFIGLFFLATCVALADIVLTSFGDQAIFHIIKESLLIAGWVAMWRPMEIFLYDWWPLRHEWRVYDRLSRATIETLVAV